MSELSQPKRDQFKHELTSLYYRFRADRDQREVNENDDLAEFIAMIQKRLSTSLDQSVPESRNLLIGKHTELMFESVLVSIGSVRSIHQLDAGTSWYSSPTQTPDYLIQLEDDSWILVEVKNFFSPEVPDADFGIRSKTFEMLREFSRQIGFDLYFAIYYAHFNAWTLVPAAVFESFGKRTSVSFLNAMKQNHMSLLGDMMIGVATPIHLTLRFDHLSEPLVDKPAEIELRFAGYEILCRGVLVEDMTEQRIAQELLLYGSLIEDDHVEMNGGRVESQTITYGSDLAPQGFEIAGSLSQLASNRYRFATQSEGSGIEPKIIDTVVGVWGRLIPEDYASDVFPIWRFIQKPNAD
ncbi:MAG: hypothetical protein KDD60_07935 [Bdellovibrionales bacterium]|nr:hypothetical protein [Bdellovibrionales bacterium]